jgi:hypothetical protein
MSVILTFTGKDGKTRRCDAKCYNAKGVKCQCICGGRGHGAGLNDAIDHIVCWLDPASLDYPGPEYKLGKNLQLPLFRDRRIYESGRNKEVTPRVTPPRAAPVPVE